MEVESNGARLGSVDQFFDTREELLSDLLGDSNEWE